MQFKCIMVTQALILLIWWALGENLTNNRDTKSGKVSLNYDIITLEYLNKDTWGTMWCWMV